MGAQCGPRFTMVEGRPEQSTEPHQQQQRTTMSVTATVCSKQAAAYAGLRSSLQACLRRRASSFDQMMAHRIESSSAQQCMSQQRCAARRQVRALDRARRAGASGRVSSCACVPAGAQADATHRAAELQALTARNAGVSARTKPSTLWGCGQ